MIQIPSSPVVVPAGMEKEIPETPELGNGFRGPVPARPALDCARGPRADNRFPWAQTKAPNGKCDLNRSID